jgi:hypothetical protein
MRCSCGFESEDPRRFLAGGSVCKACHCHEVRRAQGKTKRALTAARESSQAEQAAWLSGGVIRNNSETPISLANQFIGGKFR